MIITTIVGIIMLSIFIVPAYLLIRSQKREKKNLENLLEKLDKEKGIKVSDHETWQKKIIGIDKTGQKAVFVVRNKTEHNIQVVDLKNLSKCSVEKNMTVSEVDAGIQAVSTIRIRFRSRDKSVSDLYFTLFDEESDQMPGGELRIAESWAERYNQILRKLSHS